MRLAFGTFMGLPDPMTFMGDGDYVRTRWHVDPSAAFAATIGNDLVGSNFVSNWGSVGFFGPLTVRPDLWDRGVASRLMEPVVECFDRWNIRLGGLFTFAQSQKHVGLYQKFGFWPRFLTALMSMPVGRARAGEGWSRYSTIADRDRDAVLQECRLLAGDIYDGLDVHREIESVRSQRLGETVLIRDGSSLSGLAVCHAGPGTEAGGGRCYVKFGAIRPGPKASGHFNQLLAACQVFAAEGGAARLVAGINLARHEAYREMLAFGFRTDRQGVAMHRDNDPGYNRPGVFVIDDWR